MSYYLGNVVSVRVARLTYGVKVVQAYRADDAEHYSRRDKLVQWPSGQMMVPDGYTSILIKVCLHNPSAVLYHVSIILTLCRALVSAIKMNWSTATRERLRTLLP